MYKGSILILGFNLECPDNDVVAMNYKTIQNQFPTEIDLCGLIKFGSCTDAEAHLSEIIADVDVTDNPILLTCDTGCENLKAFLFKNGKLEEAEYEVMSEEELHKSFSFVRLRFDMREYVDDQSRIPEILQERRKYVSEAKDIVRTAFIYPSSSSFSWRSGDSASRSRALISSSLPEARAYPQRQPRRT